MGGLVGSALLVGGGIVVVGGGFDGEWKVGVWRKKERKGICLKH